MKTTKHHIPPTVAYLRRPALPPRKAIKDIRYRFGVRIRELRLEQKMTQKQMSDKLGIDRSFLSDVERGLKGPKLDMIEIFALGLRIDLSKLFHGL